MGSDVGGHRHPTCSRSPSALPAAGVPRSRAGMPQDVHSSQHLTGRAVVLEFSSKSTYFEDFTTVQDPPRAASHPLRVGRGTTLQTPQGFIPGVSIVAAIG